MISRKLYNNCMSIMIESMSKTKFIQAVGATCHVWLVKQYKMQEQTKTAQITHTQKNVTLAVNKYESTLIFFIN